MRSCFANGSRAGGTSSVPSERALSPFRGAWDKEVGKDEAALPEADAAPHAGGALVLVGVAAQGGGASEQVDASADARAALRRSNDSHADLVEQHLKQEEEEADTKADAA